MLPLVLQLQADALNSDISVSDLLLKAKVVATKLNVTDFLQWVECEINGYRDTNEVPNYREIRGTVQGYNPYRGWQNVIWPNSDMENTASTRRVFQSLSSLEDLVGDHNADTLYFPFPANLQHELARLTDFQTEFHLEIPKSSIVGIVHAVRTTILDWSLQLERAGILGDGMQFSADEKKNAKSVSSEPHFHIGNVQNLSVLGSVSDQATVTLHQSAQYTDNDMQSILRVVKEIEKNIGNLPAEPKEKIETHLTTLKSELAKPTPESTKIRSILLSIKSIAEGTVGSLIASGIVSLITPYIGLTTNR